MFWHDVSRRKSRRQIFVKGHWSKKLDTRLLSLGVCRGDACTIENIANGNVLIKTVETKIVISTNLANHIQIEVVKW